MGLNITQVTATPGSYLNQTVQRKTTNWTDNQQTLFHRIPRFDQQRGEDQRAGGVSVGPVRQNQITIRNNNIRSK